MAEIFVSYKADDRMRVAPLVVALREAGLDVWWDQDIPAGGGWRETIAAELDAARLCIVAWSASSTGPGGRYVREEAERAAARDAYLGVLIEPVVPPFGFAEWQAIDLSGWRGKAGDPLLGHFVAQVEARLANRAAPPAPALRRRRFGRPLLLAIGLAAGAALLALLLIPGRAPGPPPQTPTGFVNARLDTAGCSWLRIASVNPGEGGERIALTGIADAPDAVQASLMRDAVAAAIPISEISVDDVATGPRETCVELDLLRQYRWRGRQRLEVIQPRGSLQRTPEGWIIFFDYEVDFAGLPAHAMLLGLDSRGGVEVMIPDLHAYRRDTRPRRTEGERVTFQSGFTDDNRDTRNVGLILMTASGPIDRTLVESIGATADRAALERLAREARARHWQFELALVRCGFEGSITRRQC